ncbi:hypothetical protein [Chondromyces crocatus]|nr:hypothetical protein [Chondromyces crocatus]
MSLRRLCVAAVAMAVTTGLAVTAEAQTTIRERQVKRSYTQRREPGEQNFISYDDCINSNDFEFVVEMGGLEAGETLGIWVANEASIDCKLGTERSSATARCREIASFGSLLRVTTVNLKAKDIVAKLFGNQDPDSCTADNTSNTEPRKANIYFLRYKGSEDVTAAKAAVWSNTSVDVLGPLPPTDIQGSVGDERIVLEYKTQTNELDRRGFYFFCDDGRSAGATGTGGASSGGAGGDGGSGAASGAAGAGGDAGAGGAAGAGGSGGDGGTSSGSGGDGGTSGSGTNGSVCADTGSCTSSILVPGQRVPDDVPASFRCGSTVSRSSAEAQPAVNGSCYRVFVASYDRLGNVGVLSEPVCVTPLPVDDFYKLYRAAGGQAGGGFCSMQGPVTSYGVGTSVGIVGVAGLTFGLRRLRRRGRREHTQ